MHWGPSVYITMKDEWKGDGPMPEATTCPMSLSLCGAADYANQDPSDPPYEYVLTNYTLLLEVKERRELHPCHFIRAFSARLLFSTIFIFTPRRLCGFSSNFLLLHDFEHLTCLYVCHRVW